MNTNQTQKIPFLRLPNWIKWPLTIWFLLGIIPIFSLIFGIQYIPSPDWVSQARIPAAISGTVMGALFIWAVVMGLKTTGQKMWKVKKYGAILISPFMGFMIGSSAVFLGGPMIGAVIAGTEIEIPYIVTKFKRDVDRKCRNPITLNGLPLLSNRLCSYPEEFGRSLEIGGPIYIIGRGTILGVFAKSARRHD
ncbi:hypothetical protein MNBD_ALPHA07-1499 [hydrothermal vent metagenome]|uniref:Uncharacterized protein n=1 Tax=hydrothermal vent metagenome TaxID=652676 RepID=A0A3B0S5B8_9ZZZZ